MSMVNIALLQMAAADNRKGRLYACPREQPQGIAPTYTISNKFSNPCHFMT
jgi:hypothetical protein